MAYTGDGATISFSVPFLFLEDGHITIILRDSVGGETAWEAGTHYTLSGAGNEAGGTLTVVTSPTDHTPAVGQSLVIRRIVPETQGTDYPEGGEFPAKAHEQALDKLTMIAHQHAERLDRAIQVPASDTATTLDLPIESDRAGKFFAFDGGGNPVAAVGTSANLGPVSSFIDTLFNDADAATARATLGAEQDVFTMRGDMLIEGAVGPERLAKGGEGQILRQGADQAAWATPVALRGYIDGLILSKSAATTVGIAAGLGCADDGETGLTLSSAFTKTFSAFTEGTGTGGLDTGSIANSTWYHVFVIGKTDGTRDVLFSTSLASPTMPSGYTLKRRIGSVLTDGTPNIVSFTQVGDEFMWADPPADLDTSSLGTTSLDITLTVPTGLPVLAVFNGSVQRIQANVVLRPKAQNDEAPDDNAAPFNNLRAINSEPGATSARDAGQFRMVTDTNGRIVARSDASTTDLMIATTGWVDPRGKNI
ncbi:MAG: hypothetical protein HOH66_03130 [Rhodospirillaceae bacterium]|nr:hypothetical protein [Rhodospirillaceae bacterium]